MKLTTAKELLEFSAGEEKQVEEVRTVNHTVHQELDCACVRDGIQHPHKLMIVHLYQSVCLFCSQHIKAIADAGCKVIVTGGKIGELYLHFCNKYNLLLVRLMSKFDLRRLCKTTGATPLPRLVGLHYHP